MSDCKLFIASSLDGFIARENGSLDWLDEVGSQETSDAGYTDFIAGIDTVLIGRKTYEEILGFGIEWPYKDFHSIIVTSDTNYKASTPNTTILNSITTQSIQDIKNNSKKGIWILGGGQLITKTINIGIITELTVTIIPIILGKGIKLFPNNPKETKLKLINAQSFESGMVNLTYNI